MKKKIQRVDKIDNTMLNKKCFNEYRLKNPSCQN